jgi:hypothetical protein
MFRIACFSLFLVFLHSAAHAQLQFDPAALADPKKYGAQISSRLGYREVYEFRDTARSTFFLQNGFRSSSFVNGADWLKIADSVDVYRIDVVYSKYPLRQGVYNEIYPLLLNRLKNLFAIDASLNDAAIEWNKVLQTHCADEKQADRLPHGVLIWYSVERDSDPVTENRKVVVSSDEMRTAGAEQYSLEDTEKTIGFILESELFSDTLKAQLMGKPIDEQRNIVMTELERTIASMPDEDLTKLDKIRRKKYIAELEKYNHIFGGNDVVSKVLGRHPEWKNLYVVNDWTGSMYGYGSQVLQWHISHLETSGIEHITLFNDGDDKATTDKKIGETGGIYTEKADNIEKLILTFQLVSMRGGGGDGPENDIEAILNVLENVPDSSEIVLIADNYPCIRDIALANRIHVPVRVIVCGYKPSYGINPDLVYLARITNGGLYTIEEDLENLKAEVDTSSGTRIRTFSDKRFKLAKMSCESDDLMADGRVYNAWKSTVLKRRGKILHLDLSHDSLGTVPRRLYRFDRLQTLDLSYNELSEVGPEIAELGSLRRLNLSNNRLEELPVTAGKIRYLEELDVSHNRLVNWPSELSDMPFLQKLDLSDNELVSIEKTVQLKRLRECDLSGNRLTTLPRSFQSLKSLKVLNLTNNGFSVVPLSVANLRRLEELDMRGNGLRSLPAEMNAMNTLKILHLEDNAFTEEERKAIRERFPLTLIYF